MCSNGINTFVLTFSERTHRWFSYWRALAYSRYARTTQFPRKYYHILSPTVRPASIRCCTRFCRRTFVRRFLRYLCISRNCLQMHMYDFDARTITAQRVLKPGCFARKHEQHNRIPHAFLHKRVQSVCVCIFAFVQRNSCVNRACVCLYHARCIGRN